MAKYTSESNVTVMVPNGLKNFAKGDVVEAADGTAMQGVLDYWVSKGMLKRVDVPVSEAPVPAEKKKPSKSKKK